MRETSTLVTQVARGLAKAHAVGIVHRDLKPENLFLVDEEASFTVKILDFGIAKAFGTEAATHKTDTGQLLGTPRYMSPEQALGRAIDQRTDLYSLTVVAFRCLTGALPFTFSAVGEQIVAVSTFAPPPPSRFNPELPPIIDAWFARALEKDPASRAWQDARSLAEAFDRVCGEALSSEHLVGRRHSSSRLGRSVIPVAKDVTEAPTVSHDEIATTVLAAQPHRGPVSTSRALPRRGWQMLVPALVLVGSAGILLPQWLEHDASEASARPRAVNGDQPRSATPTPPIELPAAAREAPP